MSAARAAWEAHLSKERARLLAELPSLYGCGLLDPSEVAHNDARLEFRFVQQPAPGANPLTTAATPWRLCQMLAAEDEPASEVEFDADAFKLVTTSACGRDQQVSTLARVGDSLPHRFPFLGLHNRTALRMASVRCRLRTALLPVERPDKWRTEARCVVRHRRDADADSASESRCALLIAAALGTSLDVERPSDEQQALLTTVLAQTAEKKLAPYCFPFDVTKRFESAPPPSPTNDETFLGPDCVANDAGEYIAWQVTVPTESLQEAPPPPPPTRVASKASSSSTDSDVEWSEWESECESECEAPPPKRARVVRPACDGLERGRCTGAFDPLPVRNFSTAHSADGGLVVPVATALRIARVRANEDLSAAAVQLAARAHAAAHQRLRAGGRARARDPPGV